MSKRVFVFVLAAFLGISANAQQRGEFELGAGVNNICFSGDGFKHSNWGPSVFAEYRMGFTNGFDIGAQADFKNSVGNLMMDGGDGGPFVLNQFAIKLVGDYNFKSESSVSAFVGVGIGPCLSFLKSKSASKWDDSSYLNLGPRIGLKCGEHIRVSAFLDYELFPDWDFTVYYRVLGLNIGWIF